MASPHPTMAAPSIWPLQAKETVVRDLFYITVPVGSAPNQILLGLPEAVVF